MCELNIKTVQSLIKKSVESLSLALPLISLVICCVKTQVVVLEIQKDWPSVGPSLQSAPTHQTTRLGSGSLAGLQPSVCSQICMTAIRRIQQGGGGDKSYYFNPQSERLKDLQ